jgi:H+/Cl- antiporter ClcA
MPGNHPRLQLAPLRDGFINRFASLRRRQVAYRHLWLGRLIFWGGAVAIGLLAVGFAELIDFSVEVLHGLHSQYPFWPFLVAPAGGALVVWLTRRYFPGAEDSGIPQVMAEMARHGDRNKRLKPLLSLRIVFGKIVLGAALMAAIGERLPRRLQVDRRHLLAADGAAAFNTPLAGILFAIEELSRGMAERMSLETSVGHMELARKPRG